MLQWYALCLQRADRVFALILMFDTVLIGMCHLYHLILVLAHVTQFKDANVYTPTPLPPGPTQVHTIPLPYDITQMHTPLAPHPQTPPSCMHPRNHPHS